VKRAVLVARVLLAPIPLAPSLLALGCRGHRAAPAREAARVDSTSSAEATPVRVATVAETTLSVSVGGPGRTDALRQLKVRAPFTGTLVSLRVTDGDRVARGQEVGAVVSRNSEAALAGARAMVDAARTPAERADAGRALELARQGLVRRPLRAPEAGVVLSHAANQGDLVNEGDEILGIAAAGSTVFIAQIPQTDLPRIRPGQPATIALTARSAALPGVVHGILPSASSADLTAPVRVDFAGGRPPRGVGLFGTARIVVDELRSVQAVPAEAVLRDDIYGTTRMAAVGTDLRVRWLPVTTGVTERGLVQIVSPRLDTATRVIVAGQVGLPDGAPVRILP
jgi:RND family efflux transporter MFP subunit